MADEPASPNANPSPPASAEELAKYLGAKVADLDASRLVPMLCERESTNARILGRQGWLYELKLDGVRIIADKRGDKVALYYRKQRNATENYREIADAIKGLPDTRIILDGEIVAFDEQGRPDFQRLGHRIQTTNKSSRRAAVPVVYVVFDVLAIGPYDVRGFPLEARKEILSRIIPAQGTAGNLLRQHPTFTNGIDLFRLCREHKLEGVVAKRLGTTYKVGERSIDWLKIKCELDAEFVVIGWTEGESTRSRLGALDLGAYEGDRLVFRGRVGSGLNESMIDLLLERLLPNEVPRPVAEGKYSPKPKRHHCKPEMVVSVRYGGFSLDPSGARFLRFPVFRGIRDDVDPKDCTVAPEDGIDLNYVEKGVDYGDMSGGDVRALPDDDRGPDSTDAAPPSLAGAELVGGNPGLSPIRGIERDDDSSPPPPSIILKGAATRARTRRIHVAGGGQAILHDGTTKDEVCTYFEAVAPAVLRHTKDRVCVLKKPDGAFLWPPPKWTPTFVRTVIFKAGDREIRGFLIDSVDAMLFTVAAGAPSIHHVAVDDDHPDIADFVALRIASPTHEARIRGANAVRALAEEIGLPAGVKSAGVHALEVLLGVGKAPVQAIAPLATILARLADDDAGDGVAITAVDHVVTPFAPCPFRRAEEDDEDEAPAAVASIPLEWDSLDKVDLATLTLPNAVTRAALAATTDALDAIHKGITVDVAKAAAKIERLVRARKPTQP